MFRQHNSPYITPGLLPHTHSLVVSVYFAKPNLRMATRRQPLTLPILSHSVVDEMAAAVRALPSDRLVPVVEYICWAEGIAGAHDEEVMMIDFETLKPTTLRTLQAYLRAGASTDGPEYSPTLPPETAFFTKSPSPISTPPVHELMSQGLRATLAMALHTLPTEYLATLTGIMYKEGVLVDDGKGNVLVNVGALQPATLYAMQAYAQEARQQVERDSTADRLGQMHIGGSSS